MLKKKRITSCLLLLIFGFLFLKNLLPGLADHNHDNHNEIAHIHFYKFHTKQAAKLEDATNRQKADDDENCTSGKSVSTYSYVPSETYNIIPRLIAAFALEFNLKNHFKTPYLEPLKKPPRLA